MCFAKYIFSVDIWRRWLDEGGGGGAQQINDGSPIYRLGKFLLPFYQVVSL